MHAVIRTGGKQYRVAAQEVIRIEKIAGDEGEIVLFDQVLAVGNELGAPLVSGASVAGRVVAQAAPTRSSSSRRSAGRTTAASRATARIRRSCGSRKS